MSKTHTVSLLVTRHVVPLGLLQVLCQDTAVPAAGEVLQAPKPKDHHVVEERGILPIMGLTLKTQSQSWFPSDPHVLVYSMYL